MGQRSEPGEGHGGEKPSIINRVLVSKRIGKKKSQTNEKRNRKCKSSRKTKPPLIESTQSTKWSMPATLAKQILMFPVPVSRPTSAIVLCDWSEKQMLYQFCGSLKTYLEVVRMGFSAFRPWWYLPLWCSSSSILSWECTEVSSGRPSARAAASKASWHSICFYKKDNRFRLQNYIWSPWLPSPAILHLFLLKIVQQSQLFQCLRPQASSWQQSHRRHRF